MTGSTTRHIHLIIFLCVTKFFVADAFSIATTTSANMPRTIMLSAVTAPEVQGPAKNFEEDLRLTLAIIMDHMERSTTVSKEQFLQQMEVVQKMEVTAVTKVDVTVPYDAAAQLAYQASGSVGPFDQFKQEYEAKAVAEVIAKRQQREGATTPTAPKAPASAVVVSVDLRIPYDAAAMLAYEASADKTIPFDVFKTQYEADAVAEVIKKRQLREGSAPATVNKAEVKTAVTVVDLSVPYDAAARLAYDASSDKSMSFDVFKAQYVEKAVADVIAKRNASRS